MQLIIIRQDNQTTKNQKTIKKGLISMKISLKDFYKHLDFIVGEIKNEHPSLNDIEIEKDFQKKLEMLGVIISYVDYDSYILGTIENNEIKLNGNKSLKTLNFVGLYLTLIYYQTQKYSKQNSIFEVFYDFKHPKFYTYDKLEFITMRIVFPSDIQEEIREDIKNYSSESLNKKVTLIANKYNSVYEIVELFIKQDYQRMLNE